MDKTELIRKLLLLGWLNDKTNERQAAWRKALDVLSKLGPGDRPRLVDFSADMRQAYDGLNALFGGAPESGYRNPYTGQTGGWYDQYRNARQSSKTNEHRSDKTHVRQGPIERDVADKVWESRQCEWCGLAFRYESYPGNPRRYCSPECKKAKTNLDARWRMKYRRDNAR